MLVEFNRMNGIKISINADAVAYCTPADGNGTNICISGKEGDIVWVDMEYRLVAEALQDAMS